MSRALHRWQRGDTIVEVLVAIGVISLVLGAAYVMTNRSAQNTRAAQERDNALKLAESQVERLKGLAATNPSAVFSGPTPFCIADNGSVWDANDNNCFVNTAGIPVSTEPRFHLSIDRSGTSDFVLTETWYN